MEIFKNEVFSVLALALGMFFIMPKTEAYAAPTAQSVSSFRIIEMADQDMFNDQHFESFPDNAVETDGTIYVRVKQIGYGNVFINVDGVSRKFQEVEIKAITEDSNYGRVIVGWVNTYKIDNLTNGMHNVEFGCIGTGFPSRVIKDTAKINKL